MTTLSLVWFLIDTKSQVSAEISDSITAPSDEIVNSDKVDRSFVIVLNRFIPIMDPHPSSQ